MPDSASGSRERKEVTSAESAWNRKSGRFVDEALICRGHVEEPGDVEHVPRRRTHWSSAADLMTTVVHGLDIVLVQRVRALEQPAFSGGNSTYQE